MTQSNTTSCTEVIKQLEERIYELEWALHIEVDGDHGHECDCKDHMEAARKLVKDFRCPGAHCQKRRLEQRAKCVTCDALVSPGDRGMCLGCRAGG